jgi:hypothetical protein
VRFVSADFLNLPDAFSALTEAEMFVIMKVDNDPGASPSYNGAWEFGCCSSGQGSDHIPFTDGNIYSSWGCDTRHTVGNSPYAMSSFHYSNVRSASGSFVWKMNYGGFSYTTGANTVSFTTTPTIGKNISGGGYYLVGDIAEMIIYDHVLTGGDRTTVESYIAAKYPSITF